MRGIGEMCGSPETVKSNRQSTVVDVYMEMTEKILAMIDDSRRQIQTFKQNYRFC